jgi:hypothetical protein
MRLVHWSDYTNIFSTIGHSTRTIAEFVDLLREHWPRYRRKVNAAVAR